MCGVSCAASVTASDSRDVPASGPASTANGSSSAAVDMSGTALAMNSQPFRSLRGYSGRWPACCQRRPGPAASLGFVGSCGCGCFPVPAAALPPPVGCRRWGAGASMNEAVADSEGRLLAGITDWCSHPPGLRAARIGGTKNPDIAGIAALAPDLVLANEEENRPADLAALRALGLPVWVTRVRTLGEAFSSLHRMITLAGRLPRPKR